MVYIIRYIHHAFVTYIINYKKIKIIIDSKNQEKTLLVGERRAPTQGKLKGVR